MRFQCEYNVSSMQKSFNAKLMTVGFQMRKLAIMV
jgi:hypothetical protein